MPRLTYSPSRSSAAARAAICSRVRRHRSAPPRGATGDSALLDPLVCCVGGRARCAARRRRAGATASGSSSPGSTSSLDLGDRDPAGHGAQRVEVAGALSNTRLPCRSPLAARTSAKSVDDRLLEDVRDCRRTRGPPSRARRAATRAVRRVAPGQAAVGDLACRRRSGCRTPGSRSRRRAAARPACPAGRARPRARR